MLLDKYGFKPKRFIRESFFEIVCTPASFYHGLRYFLKDKKLYIGRLLDLLILFPLVFIKVFLRILFFNENQNIKAISVKRLQ